MLLLRNRCVLTDSRAVLTHISSTPGVMIAMSPTISLKGAIKFSLKKMLIGGEMAHSTFTGPGELLLAPNSLGDVIVLRIESTPAPAQSSQSSASAQQWTVARDGFLASTQGVVKDYKAQGVGKGMFSGEGWFVYRIGGMGLVWITSFGAIVRKHVSNI